MKQVVQDFRTGELRVDDLPVPVLRPGGVLVATAFSLISAGTERGVIRTAQSSLIGKARDRPDLVRQVIGTFKREGLRSTYEKVKSKLNQVKPLGYSAAGIIAEVGDGAGSFRVGDPVACAGAGYASHAEVIFVPANLCCPVPQGVSLKSASYATVGSIALHGVRQADARIGEAVVVIGLGLVGQLTVQILKAAGCHVLGVDPEVTARELAEKSGADAVVADAAEALSACLALTSGRGADSVLITASTSSDEPVELAGEIARDRARIVVVGLVGMNVPRQVYYAKELDLRLSRSYGPGRYDPQYEERGVDYPLGYVRWTEKRNMEAFLRLVAEGKVNTDLLTTNEFSIEAARQAYDLLLDRDRRYCGVILKYPRAAPLESTVVRRSPVRSGSADAAVGAGFIGAGNFARGVLLPILRRARGLRLTGVCTATGVSARNTAEQFGFDYATTDFRRVLEDEKTTCVFIATRHNLHARLAAAALRSGKAVFVEKPLATTRTDLREVLVAARESQRVLMVGYNRRFSYLASKVKEKFRARSGPMTILYRVNAGQLSADHWALDPTEGGGRIIGEVCHFVDFIQYMTGSFPVSVTADAVGNGLASGFPDDSTVISLSMGDGSVATIVYAAGGDSTYQKERIEVFCNKTVAVIEDFRRAELVRDGKTVRYGGRSQDKGHRAEITRFLNVTSSGDELPISLESMAGTGLACFGAVESVRSGKAVDVDIASLMV